MDFDPDLRVVTTTADGMTAAIIQGRLEAEGIPSMLRPAGLSSWLFPGGPSGFGAVDILVPANRLDEATQVLAEEPEGETS
jgi:hypothetical protein